MSALVLGNGVVGAEKQAVALVARLGLPHRLERWLPQKQVDLDGSGEEEFVFKIPRHPLIFWLKNLAPDILVSALLQLVSAAVFCAIEPGWDFGDALYHCMVTATTVGYGDMSLETFEGRVCAIVRHTTHGNPTRWDPTWPAGPLWDPT